MRRLITPNIKTDDARKRKKRDFTSVPKNLVSIGGFINPILLEQSALHLHHLQKPY